MRRIAWIVGPPTVAGVFFAAWMIGGWGSDKTVQIADDLGLVVFAAFGSVSAALAARTARDRQRMAWICFSVGLGGWAVGSALWAYFELWAHTAPFPSLADAAYLVFPIAACLGIALFPIGYSSHSRTRMVLDGVIVAGALFEVAWVLVLYSVYQTGGSSTFAVGLSMAYPIADVVIITVAVIVLARATTRQRTTLTMLTLGIVMIALSDGAFVYLQAQQAYGTASKIDIGWAAGLLVIGIAALLARVRPASETVVPLAPSLASTWLPYLPLAVAAVVCFPSVFPVPGIGALLLSSCVLITAVLARQLLVVGENRRLLKTVADQALRDPLTGLANRALFNDRLTHAMHLHRRDNQSVAVLSMDLDDFKLVNDSFGHHAGDELLALAAERLLGCARASDTVARLGGDEFAVLMEGRPEHARLIAHRVVQAFDDPFVIDGRDLVIRMSIGLAVVSAEDPQVSADALLKQADVAMYSGKRARRGGVHTYTPDMHLIEPHELDLAFDTSGDSAGGGAAVRLLGELRCAIDRVDLSLVYQPKFALSDGEIVGVEALVRWPHRDRGLLGPDNFLPLVREHGLMRSVTELVLAQALDDVAAWREQGLDVPVAVNMFAPSLGDLELPSRIVKAHTERGLSPHVLTVEITEDLLLGNMDRTRAVLDDLRSLGVRVSLDDFGSGYSALSYLRELPIDEVKLDKNFIAPILVDRRAAAIVRAVIDLAHDLGVTTVAEGIENAETADRLSEYGCEIIQGYHCSPPVDAAAIPDLIRGAQPCCAGSDCGSVSVLPLHRPSRKAPAAARSS